MQVSLQVTAICAEPSTWPAGWNLTRDVAEPDLLAIADRLRRAGEILAIAQPHHVQRFLRRQHRAVAGAGMVGMAVGDHGALDRADRIDVEAAGLAAQAGSNWQQDVLRTHALLYRSRPPHLRVITRFASWFPMPAAPVPVLRRSHGRPPLRVRARPPAQGRSARRRRPDGAGPRACAEFHLGLVHARRNPRAARRARQGHRGLSEIARVRSRAISMAPICI